MRVTTRCLIHPIDLWQRLEERQTNLFNDLLNLLLALLIECFRYEQSTWTQIHLRAETIVHVYLWRIRTHRPFA